MQKKNYQWQCYSTFSDYFPLDLSMSSLHGGTGGAEFRIEPASLPAVLGVHCGVFIEAVGFEGCRWAGDPGGGNPHYIREPIETIVSYKGMNPRDG